ncbi:hypothetical protein LTR70_001568 [Exophiala xenobiotica]|uniref:Uncharacterized protein n=1 Tax=Lithohypha guttulata TaxID=1690604 RepID=A0ABR0KD70_9EURO|nr:hypothetical protein LTR24_003986 [Lithohypha guttulata]KAK5327945.1 hypothetical protein LTR70_001568 [Exophiala xenobiotica]
MSARFIPFRRAFAARSTLYSTRLPARYASTGGQAQSGTHNDNPQREAQEDREKMDTQSNEYAKSGTDTATAGQDEAAFDPDHSNDPEDEMNKAGEGNDVNPLNASPANPDISSGTSEVSGGAKEKGSEGGGGRSGGGDETGNK